MRSALITGATGFVGQHLLRYLNGWSINAVVRKDTQLPEGICRIVIESIDAQTDWSAALRNTECVIHLAAHVHVMAPTAKDSKRFFEVNVQGTERLALAAAAAGIKRFVFLSSVKVNGESTTQCGFTATDIPHPEDEYGRSKLQAEDRLLAIARGTQMRTVAIRSPLVYGPGVQANFLRLMSWVYKGIPLPLGSVENRRSMISIWNLCDLIKQVVDTSSIESGVLMASDGDDLSTPDLVRRLAYSLGRSARLFPVPISLLKAVGAATGKNAEVARLCGSLMVDISETRRKLDWTPPVSVDQGLERTARWFLDEVKDQRG